MYTIRIELFFNFLLPKIELAGNLASSLNKSHLCVIQSLKWSGLEDQVSRLLTIWRYSEIYPFFSDRKLAILRLIRKLDLLDWCP